jgi:hypothetical protein
VSACRGAVVAGLAVLTAASAGCGESRLDPDRVESALRSGITRQTGVKIETVRCPDEVEAREGGTFSCTARTSTGRRARVEVTQRDAQGSVSWRVVRAR